MCKSLLCRPIKNQKGPFKNDVTKLAEEGYPKLVTKSDVGVRGCEINTKNSYV